MDRSTRGVEASALSSAIDADSASCAKDTPGAGTASAAAAAAEATPESLKDSPSLRRLGGEIPLAPDEEQMCVGVVWVVTLLIDAGVGWVVTVLVA